MDAASRAFILMVIIAVVFGVIVLIAIPEHRIPNIYQSNKNYYPGVTPESLKKSSLEISKPYAETTTEDIADY